MRPPADPVRNIFFARELKSWITSGSSMAIGRARLDIRMPGNYLWQSND